MSQEAIKLSKNKLKSSITVFLGKMGVVSIRLGKTNQK